MKTILIALFFTFSFGSISSDEILTISIGGDSSLEVYRLNEKNGDLTKLQKIIASGRTGNSVFSHDGKYLYTSIRSKDKIGLDTFEVLSDGQLKHIHFAKTPEGCGYITLDQTGEYLLASHYTPGKVSIYRIINGVCHDKVVQIIDTDERAHCILVDQNNQYAYVPHTSPNKIYQYQFTKEGLVPLKQPFANGPDTKNKYHEPRHICFHPKKKVLYSSNERGGGLSSWKINSKGELSLWQTFSTLPDRSNWNSAASDVKITPNGKFIYVANRYGRKNKDPKPKDSIASFLIDPNTGKIIKRTSIVPVGRHSRCLQISEKGTFLYATGVQSADIRSYTIDPKKGSLTPLKSYPTGPNPMWMSTLKIR